MENLSTLTGKYGEEGDQLIFKILNNGDFLAKADEDAIQSKDSKKLAFSISKKALRYDLTVPFARFVVMNQNEITMPFKRFQIQPVWRGDRPGKGRYQEFYQCDADIVGSDSLLYEVELIQLFDNVLSDLGIPGFSIKINNRKVLAGIAEIAGVSDKLTDMCVAIDKLDKIGADGVKKELTGRGFTTEQITTLQPLFGLEGSNEERLEQIANLLASSELGSKGVEELRHVLKLTTELGLRNATLELDITLARGLNYYTGAIFEVKAHDVQIGSICGGGRYDDLTGIFGLPGVSGVGISFGADRIYDVMEALDIFPQQNEEQTQLLFVNFGTKEELYCMKLAKQLRAKGLNVEVYPEAAKMKKQMKFANDKNVPFVAIVGSSEMETGQISVKQMESGDQHEIDSGELAEFVLGAMNK